MKQMNPGDMVLWNGEEATLLEVRTPEEQRQEWLSHPNVVASWYTSGEDGEPEFEMLYEVKDKYGVNHVINGEKEFQLIQQGNFRCCTCIAIHPISQLALRHYGDCVCVACMQHPETRRARYPWLEEGKPKGGE